jgi:hypothetical protein
MDIDSHSGTPTPPSLLPVTSIESGSSLLLDKLDVLLDSKDEKKHRRRTRTPSDKAAKTKRRRASRQNRKPNERQPQSKNWSPKQLPTDIVPREDFSTVSSGFTGKRMGAILEKRVLSLQEVLDKGFELVKWDGK